MKFLVFAGIAASAALSSPAWAEVDAIVSPLPCGIYNQSSRPFVEKDLITQSSVTADYTMSAVTTGGRQLTVEVKSVSIRMAGERAHVSIFLDGKPLAKTSHQDVPIYLEVHVDNEKYRIICTRQNAAPGPAGFQSSGAPR